jgi:hypothetical protein
MMNPIRLKGLLIALVALSLSAGAAFASSNGLTTAAGASGKTVPVNAQPSGTSGEENATEDSNETDQDSTDTKDTTESTAGTSGTNDNCATSPVGLDATALAAMTHGQIVCWAAHQGAQEGYANHGAFVSHWATMGKTPNANAAQGLSHKGKGTANKP